MKKTRKVLGAFVGGVALLLAGCGSSTSASGRSYTVSQAASSMAANEPTSPFTNQAYDRCLAIYMFKHMSRSAVRAYINGPNFAINPNAIEKAAEDNCVMVGVGQG